MADVNDTSSGWKPDEASKIAEATERSTRESGDSAAKEGRAEELFSEADVIDSHGLESSGRTRLDQPRRAADEMAKEADFSDVDTLAGSTTVSGREGGHPGAATERWGEALRERGERSPVNNR